MRNKYTYSCMLDTLFYYDFLNTVSCIIRSIHASKQQIFCSNTFKFLLDFHTIQRTYYVLIFVHWWSLMLESSSHSIFFCLRGYSNASCRVGTGFISLNYGLLYWSIYDVNDCILCKTLTGLLLCFPTIEWYTQNETHVSLSG